MFVHLPQLDPLKLKLTRVTFFYASDPSQKNHWHLGDSSTVSR